MFWIEYLFRPTSFIVWVAFEFINKEPPRYAKQQSCAVHINREQILCP